MKITATLFGGIGFFCGFMVAWLVGLADGPVSKEVISSVTDTLVVEVHDTSRVTDTLTLRPELIYRSRIVRDTSGMDSMRAIIESLRQYAAEKTFKDSAWVRHQWSMDANWLVRQNAWDYRPAPRTEIHFRDTVEVKPKAAKKLLYGAGLFAAGGVAALVVENNK